MHRNRSKPIQISDPQKTYKDTFRCRCFELIHASYNTLTPKSLRNEEEPAVTGELVKSIREVMDDSKAPDWMSFYTVNENVPLNVPGKRGKSRPLVDIDFESTNSRHRTHFRLESKWVGAQKKSLGDKEGYLGKEGIGCFLSGKYPTTIGHAGMLAYVHSDNVDTWAKKIEKHLIEKADELKVMRTEGKVWARDEAQEGFCAFITNHDCQGNVGQLRVTHLLLDFLN